MSAYIWGGIGDALSRHAQRRDLDRRAEQEFQREKDLYKYRLEQDELAARAALAAEGSEREREMMRRGGYQADRGVDYGFGQQEAEADDRRKRAYEKDYYKAVWNDDGTLNEDESGPGAVEEWRTRGRAQEEAALRHKGRKGGPGVSSPSGLGPDRGAKKTASKTKGSKTRGKPKPQKQEVSPATKQVVDSVGGLDMGVVPALNQRAAVAAGGIVPEDYAPPVPEPVVDPNYKAARPYQWGTGSFQ